MNFFPGHYGRALRWVEGSVGVAQKSFVKLDETFYKTGEVALQPHAIVLI